MAVTIKETLRMAVEAIKKTDSKTPLLDAEVLLSYVLKKDRLYLFVHGNEKIRKDQWEIYIKLVDKRIEGIPVQYLTHKQEFMGLEFYVEEGVLIPRPDTEILVEAVIHYGKNKEKPLNILDLGTGSGAITVSLAKYIPNSHVYSVDISKVPLRVAKKNGEIHGVEEKITLLEGDLFTPLEERNLYDTMDILVSNPPYIPKRDIKDLQIEVSKYEPKIALDGGEDGLDFYRRIIHQGYFFLKNGGFIALEVGHDQADKIVTIMKKKKFYKNIKKIKDLSGIERVVVGNIEK